LLIFKITSDYNLNSARCVDAVAELADPPAIALSRTAGLDAALRKDFERTEESTRFLL
jgi:hypothetical protein